MTRYTVDRDKYGKVVRVVKYTLPTVIQYSLDGHGDDVVGVVTVHRKISRLGDIKTLGIEGPDYVELGKVPRPFRKRFKNGYSPKELRLV